MKIILIFLLITINFAVLSQTALAQEEPTEIDLPKVNILPSSPIYFLKIWSEKVQLWLTVQPEIKIKLMLKFAENRLFEYQNLRAQSEDKLAERALKLYTQQLEEAIQKIEESHNQDIAIDEATSRAIETTQKHWQVLSQAYDKAPEPAKKGLSKAIQASRHGFEITQEIFSGQRRQEIQEKTGTLTEKIEKGIRGLMKKLWPTSK